MQWYIKFTTSDRLPTNGVGRYPSVGQWTRRIKDVELCQRGWHMTWLEMSPLFERSYYRTFVCQADGQIIKGDDKLVAERMRLLFEVKEADAMRLLNHITLLLAKRDGLLTSRGLKSYKSRNFISGYYGNLYTETEIDMAEKYDGWKARNELMTRAALAGTGKRVFQAWVNRKLKELYPNG